MPMREINSFELKNGWKQTLIRDSIESFNIDLNIRLRNVESILEFFHSGSDSFLYNAL